jgi:hypothetical protein
MTDLTWTNTTATLGQLQPWAHNPRQSTKAQARRLLESWAELGQFQTIAIGPANADGKFPVYDGHQRLSALLTLYGPAYVIDARQSNRALTDEERHKLVITAHVGSVGQWDWNALSGWDADKLQAWGMDSDKVKEWRGDISNLSAMLTAEEEEPQAPDEFKEYGADIETEHTCPKCGYKYSGGK